MSIKSVLRADYKNGRWVACDWMGGGIGGSINIIRHTHNLGFKEAVELLTGQSFHDPVRSSPPTKAPRLRRTTALVQPKKIKVPTFLSDKTEGRAYLRSRGVSMEAIRHCEHAGSLAYTNDGVCFIGSDDAGDIRYIAHRFYQEQEAPDGTMRNKKDELHSSKEYTFSIKPEGGKYTTYLVEGGINALSLYDLLARKGEDAFIVTTGSVSARGWMKNPSTLARIAKGGDIVMVCENESKGSRSTAERKQYDTDALRLDVLTDLRDALKEAGYDQPRTITTAYPPVGFGDVNDYMAHVETMDHDRVERFIQTFLERIEKAETLDQHIERFNATEPPPTMLFIKPIIAQPPPPDLSRPKSIYRESAPGPEENDSAPAGRSAQKRRLSVPVVEPEDDHPIPPEVLAPVRRTHNVQRCVIPPIKPIERKRKDPKRDMGW